jgi:hypothetical protein
MQRFSMAGASQQEKKSLHGKWRMPGLDLRVGHCGADARKFLIRQKPLALLLTIALDTFGRVRIPGPVAIRSANLNIFRTTATMRLAA